MKFVVLFLIFGFFQAISTQEENTQRCVICDSGKDVLCAQDSPQLIPEDCTRDPYKGCYMRVVDKRVIRGCVGDLDDETLRNCSSKTCEFCKHQDLTICNEKIFPVDHLSCHICEGALNSPCFYAVSSQRPAFCPEYDENNKCFIRKTAKGVERGCLSSSGSKCNNENECYKCTDHGCNDISADNQKVPLSSTGGNILPTLFLIAVTFLTVHFMN